MMELGNPPRGLYEGSYVIQPGDHAKQAAIAVTLKKQGTAAENRPKAA